MINLCESFTTEYRDLVKKKILCYSVTEKAQPICMDIAEIETTLL
jgi:hypothetical protein